MRTKRITMRVLAGVTLFAGLGGTASAQLKPDEVLARKPVQPGVAVADTAGCRVEAVAWPKAANGVTPTGVVVKDAQGRTVRQFIDTAGGQRPNIWSFYQDGVEVYREVDGNGNGKPDQYRWLGATGSKWGVDINEDGVVDAWAMISPAEVSQELLQAMATKDARRLSALLPSDQELQSLGLPADEAGKIRQRTAGAVRRMQDAADALKLTGKEKWVHLELDAPQLTPREAVGAAEDLLRQPSATVLFDRGDGKAADLFQTGELVLINKAWKLIDGPTPGAAQPGAAGGGPVLDKAVQDLITKLATITPPAANEPAALVKYHTDRAAVLEQIAGKLEGAQQEPWLKQTIDAYAGAAELKDAAAMQRLGQWVAVIEKTAPKSAPAAYAALRATSAEYAVKLGSAVTEKDVTAVQKWWREALEAFVAKYPTAAEETPEAELRLAIAHEFNGKDGETQAKTWYERLAKDFPTHPYAARAQGAVRRLTCEGQPFVLTGQTLGGEPFDAARLNGKVTAVVFWASWGNGAVAELKQLAELQKAYAAKGLEIVTVSVDDDAAKAVAALQAAQLGGTHLHAAGGLDRSPLATAYGIQMVPHVFLVGRDGKVVNRNAQTGPTLKDEVEKLVK